MAKALYVIGTNTDIGKTYISALIVKALRQRNFKIGYYKPVLSGAIKTNSGLIPGDVKQVYEAGGLHGDYQQAVSYMFEPAVSPHLAFKMQNKAVDLSCILKDFYKYQNQYDYVLVEGCGGLICPISITEKNIVLQEDIIKLLNLQTILVIDAGLGTINHSLLTVYYAEQKKIIINGIIMNNYDSSNLVHQDNKKVIEELTGIKVIACVPTQGKNNEPNSIKALTIEKYFHEIGDVY